MTSIEILGAPQSPYVWVTRIACIEKGITHSLVGAMPHSAEINAIHPFGKMPVMRHGEVALCESRAICVYIDRLFDGPPLVPTNPVEGARTEQWISILLTHVDPIVVHRYIAAYYFPGTPDGSPDRCLIDGALGEIARLLHVLDCEVNRTGYLASGTFTLADAYLMAFLFYLNKLPESHVMLQECGALQPYFQRHLRRHSLQATTPPAFEREPMSNQPITATRVVAA